MVNLWIFPLDPSGCRAGRSEAPDTLRNDPRLLAAPYETAALPQSLQSVLCPVGRCHQPAEVRTSPALHQALPAVLW